MAKRWLLSAALVALIAAACPGQTSPRDDLAQALASGRPLAGTDFSGLALAGMEFTSCDLAHTKWRQTDLRGARFTNCKLTGADFTGAALNGTGFQGCILTDALFTDAALVGAYLSTCDLSGSLFDKADLAGATLADVTLFPTGASHLPAIAAAIELRGGARPTPAWLAAASGDAFAFTYDRSNRGGWPGAPMTFGPVTLALDTLGYDAAYKTGLDTQEGARKELSGVLRRGLVAVLPVRLGGAGLKGNAVEGASWVAAHDLQAGQTGPEQVALRTPFGSMTLPLDDLVRRWEGPWPALMPAGEGAFEARFPICTVGAQKAEVADATAAVAALRNASAIMNEPRSFGGAAAGFDAYQALIQDAGDPNLAVTEIALWSGAPRRELGASRALAAAFLQEAAPKLPEHVQRPMLEAAAWYTEIAVLLTQEWPLPEAGPLSDDQAVGAASAATLRRPHVRALLEECLARERRAVALLDQAVAEALKGV